MCVFVVLVCMQKNGKQLALFFCENRKTKGKKVLMGKQSNDDDDGFHSVLRSVLTVVGAVCIIIATTLFVFGKSSYHVITTTTKADDDDLSPRYKNQQQQQQQQQHKSKQAIPGQNIAHDEIGSAAAVGEEDAEYQAGYQDDVEEEYQDDDVEEEYEEHYQDDDEQYEDDVQYDTQLYKQHQQQPKQGLKKKKSTPIDDNDDNVQNNVRYQTTWGAMEGGNPEDDVGNLKRYGNLRHNNDDRMSSSSAWDKKNVDSAFFEDGYEDDTIAMTSLDVENSGRAWNQDYFGGYNADGSYARRRGIIETASPFDMDGFG